MNLLTRVILATILFSGVAAPMTVHSESEKLGIVILHGKGGSPAKFVADLAGNLEQKAYLVANLEMPWSGKRDYDAPVAAAEAQVEQALSALRARGAKKVFVAGHSQGGAFALYFGGKHDVDGIVCIAPGGSSASRVARENLAASVARAKQLVDAGKGDEVAKLDDFESRKGTYTVVSKPNVYLTWFDPEGAMNMDRAARAINPRIPVLWIVPERDYPGLRKTTIPLFADLPKHAHTRLYEPSADHIGAPTASLDEIVRWTTEVAGSTR